MGFSRRSETATAWRKLTREVPPPYQVWLRQAAYDYIEGLRISERQRILVWIERLGTQPTRDGDFTERGSDGRDWQVAVIAGHAVVWWVDSPVREVKIVAIRSADTSLRSQALL